MPMTMANRGMLGRHTLGMKRRIFVTGPPGVGKTTLIVRVSERLKEEYPALSIHGFYTREKRDGAGIRTGFEAVTLSGKNAQLATTGPIRSSSGSGEALTPRVGKYNVDLFQFESVILPELNVQLEGADQKDDSANGPNCKHVFVIDEVGKMELFSRDFFPAVCAILDSSAPAVLGTVPVPNRQGREIPEVEQIKTRGDVALYTLSQSNRDAMTNTVFHHIKMLLTPTLLTPAESLPI